MQMKMMRKSDKVVCSVVGLLGMAAAILAFLAEAHRVRLEEVQVTLNGSCIYPKSSTPILAVTAATALFLAQVIANSVVSYSCCTSDRHPPNYNRTIAVICLVPSWITFEIAFILLIGGAIVSSKHSEDETSNDCCKVVKSKVFVSGAVLALANMALTIVYFIKASIAMNSSQCKPQIYNIIMDTPQNRCQNVNARASKV